jgi:hypothetical protein
MLQSLCVELSGQSSNSSMDQGERASVERRFAADHLKDTVNLSDKTCRGDGKRFILFISVNTW